MLNLNTFGDRLQTKLSAAYIESKRVRIDVTFQDRLSSASASKGNQLKWFANNLYIKANFLGYEDYAEIISSWVASFVKNSDFEYVKYYPCAIYEDSVFVSYGCFSENFLKDGEGLSFLQILNANLLSTSVGYDEIREIIYHDFNYDCETQLQYILEFDCLIRNEDRHFGNLELLKSDSVIKMAPLFDNGDALLSDCLTYPLSYSTEDAFYQLKAKPFYTCFEKQISPYSKKLKIREAELLDSLIIEDNVKFNRAITVLKMGLEQSRGVAWEEVI